MLKWSFDMFSFCLKKNKQKTTGGRTTALYLEGHKALISVQDCFQAANIYFSHVLLKCIHTLTIRKHIVVNRGGRQETAQLWLGVVLLQSEPLSAAVNPCSPPHCRRWALHRFSSHTAGIQQRLTTRILNCLVSNNKATVAFYTEI